MRKYYFKISKMTQFGVLPGVDFASKMTRSPVENAIGGVVSNAIDITSSFSPDVIEKSNPEILKDILERKRVWRDLAIELGLDESLVGFDTIFNLNTGENPMSHPKKDIFCLRVGKFGTGEISLWMNDKDQLMSENIEGLMNDGILRITCMQKSDFEYLQRFTQQWNNSQRRRFFRLVLKMQDGNYVLGDTTNAQRITVANIGKNINFPQQEGYDGLHMRWRREPYFM